MQTSACDWSSTISSTTSLPRMPPSTSLICFAASFTAFAIVIPASELTPVRSQQTPTRTWLSPFSWNASSCFVSFFAQEAHDNSNNTARMQAIIFFNIWKSSSFFSIKFVNFMKPLAEMLSWQDVNHQVMKKIIRSTSTSLQFGIHNSSGSNHSVRQHLRKRPNPCTTQWLSLLSIRPQ